MVEKYIISNNLYRNNLDKQEINNFIKQNLDEKRYIHSINVSNIAVKLAKVYNINEEKAEIAALLHDNAKNLSSEDIFKYIKDYKIQLNEIDLKSPQILHSFVGAYIAKQI
ncbi:bis(5'-nucleosyl)-tetraphosphatase (symmetrical) YqeK [Caloramator sp. mosi_1]|uniref:bis(5'-nucleosyl)-tetraphosphatase (symmetrical) YqeK n=1 Tax=Caloramator sp. mosi_1 TaxID=3023090 RepID=UPI002363163B|nr:bis(5'-nucleosyl)-tetraphosphatase (symmetrical) YqeK [Caloramator sp. mosi_1]WDC85838.1 bis(5'-nucleosyl)-tetraphosphatase (symmetrical) YqeK [Caloramator sp. mosi_1]